MWLLNDLTTLDLLGAKAPRLTSNLVTNSPRSIALLAPTGRVLMVSAGAVTLWGLGDESQIVGRHWCKTWPSATHAALSEAVGRALRGEITTYWANYPNIDDAPTNWDVRISPVFDGAGTVKSVLAVSRPVTKH